MINQNNGLFVAISGPSGVGKGSIIKLLKERFKDAIYVISNTTRAPRPGESDGYPYYFVSEQSFKKGIDQGEYLEWALVHQGAFYGILRKPVEAALKQGKIIIREVDLQGYRILKKNLPTEILIGIFIVPENFESLKKHILGRAAMTDEELQRRLNSANIELQAAQEFTHQVVNPEGKLEDGYQGVLGVILDEAKKRGLLIKRFGL